MSTIQEKIQAEIDAHDKNTPFAIFRIKRNELEPGARKSKEVEGVFMIDFVNHGHMNIDAILRFERQGMRFAHLHIPEGFRLADKEAQGQFDQIVQHLERSNALRAEIAREMAEAAMQQKPEAPKLAEVPQGINAKLAARRVGKSQDEAE
jgi:hypothetical protein